MISILCLFSLIHLGTCSKRIPRGYQKKRLLDDDITTACDLCQNLDSAIIRYEGWGYTDDQIQASLLSNCNILSGKSEEVCHYIADTYFPVFLYLAKKDVAALTTCIKMGYCSDLENTN